MGMDVAACGSAPGTVQPVISGTLPASNVDVLGGPYGSPAASRSPSDVPAGYKSTGDAVRGISVAVPDSWVMVPLNVNVKAAASYLSVLGLSEASITELVPDMEAVKEEHGSLFVDVRYARANPKKFTPNLGAVCLDSGTTDMGAVGVAVSKTSLAREVESKFGATHITQKDLKIGGVPGLETSYQVGTKLGTLYQSALTVFPKPNDVCTVEVTAGEGVPMGNVISAAAAAARFT
jgi:hypothetical protein